MSNSKLDQRVEVYMSLARGATFDTHVGVLESHEVADMKTFTKYVAEDILGSDSRLSSTVLFMCITCRKEVYRHFDMNRIATACANLVDQTHRKNTLALRALGETLLSSVLWRLVSELETFHKLFETLVDCVFELVKFEGDAKAAAISICALRSVEEIVSVFLGSRPFRESVRSPLNSGKGMGGRRHELRRVLSNQLIGQEKMAEVGHLIRLLHQSTRGVAVRCIRRCLEFVGAETYAEDAFKNHQLLAVFDTLLSTPSSAQSSATRQEACLGILQLGGNIPMYLQRAYDCALELMDSVSSRANGVSCFNLTLIQLMVQNLKRLECSMERKTEYCAAIGIHLRRSVLSQTGCSLGSIHKSEVCMIAQWVDATLSNILYADLKNGESPGGISLLASLGLTEGLDIDKTFDIEFNKLVFACVSECIVMHLRDEFNHVNQVDWINMAYAQQSKHSDLLVWFEIAVKALDEFGTYKDRGIKSAKVKKKDGKGIQGGEVLYAESQILPLVAYSNLLHACLSTSFCLKEGNVQHESPECTEKLQFLDQLLNCLVYDILDNFKTGSIQEQKVVYLDALHDLTLYGDIIQEIKQVVAATTRANGAEGNAETEEMGGGDALQATLLGKIIHILKEVLLTRCMSLEGCEEDNLYAESLAGLCSITEAYVSRILGKIASKDRFPHMMEILVRPILQALQEFAQSDQLDLASREQLSLCVGTIMQNVKVRGQKLNGTLASLAEFGFQNRNDNQFNPSAILDAMPPTLLAVAKEGRNTVGLGSLLASVRFACRSARRNSSTNGNLSKLKQFGCNRHEKELLSLFPKKHIFSARGDLVHMTATCVPFVKNSDICDELHFVVNFEVRNATASRSFEYICITLGTTGPCRVDKRSIEVRDLGKGGVVSFDILLDVFAFGPCTLVPHLAIILPSSRSASLETQKHTKVNYYTGSAPRALPVQVEEDKLSSLFSANMENKILEYALAPLRCALSCQFVKLKKDKQSQSLSISEFQQLWMLFAYEGRVDFPSYLNAEELWSLTECLQETFNFSTQDPLQALKKIDDQSSECLDVYFTAETFDKHIVLCTMSCTRSIEENKSKVSSKDSETKTSSSPLYIVRMHFKSSALRFMHALKGNYFLKEISELI